jgi:asparagine N-glycosylation enzyme membrane subunit Stt3
MDTMEMLFQMGIYFFIASCGLFLLVIRSTERDSPDIMFLLIFVLMVFIVLSALMILVSALLLRIYPVAVLTATFLYLLFRILRNGRRGKRKKASRELGEKSKAARQKLMDALTPPQPLPNPA